MNKKTCLFLLLLIWGGKLIAQDCKFITDFSKNIKDVSDSNLYKVIPVGGLIPSILRSSHCLELREYSYGTTTATGRVKIIIIDDRDSLKFIEYNYLIRNQSIPGNWKKVPITVDESYYFQMKSKSVLLSPEFLKRLKISKIFTLESASTVKHPKKSTHYPTVTVEVKCGNKFRTLFLPSFIAEYEHSKYSKHVKSIYGIFDIN